MPMTLNDRTSRIEKVVLKGTRPRSIGYNARIPTHGPNVTDHVVRIHTEGGAVGVGWSGLGKEAAEGLKVLKAVAGKVAH